MQNILFVGTDFEQYLRLKTVLNEFNCVYSVNLPDGIRRFNQQQFCLIILNLSLILSDAGQEELLHSVRHAHPVPIIALYDCAKDSDIVRFLDAGADQVLASNTPDAILAAYSKTLINRYTSINYMDRDQNCRTELCIGDFKIDFMRHQAFLKGENYK